jgi:uracil-DNA glycosylase
VPPENKPTTAEIKTCLRFLKAELAAARGLEMVLALGTVAHGAVLSALDLKKNGFPFRHGAVHELPGSLLLADSYHCSRYNTNTGRLTVGMFEAVFSEVRRQLVDRI